MKLIRWGGILTFIILISLITGFWFFFADDLLQHAIESSGSDAAEAEVSIADLDISFIPLGIEIKKLEVANAKSPMRNSLEFDRAVAHMDFLKLLQGQVIIESLAVEGLRFDTQRMRASTWTKKIPEPAREVASDSMFSIPDIQIQLPEVNDVLLKEDLVTTKMSKQLQSDYAQQMLHLEAAFNRIPNADKFKNYEDRVKAATTGKVTSLDNFKQRKHELDTVHDAVRADQQALKDARQQLTTSKELLSADMKALKAAPGDDVSNLKNKYKLDESNAANISRLLFGEQAGGWTKTGLYYYNKLKPVLESDKKEKHVRLKGRYVHFHSDHPSPDFLLKDAHVDVELPFGHLSAQLQNLTHQMYITGKPATLTVRGVKLHNMKSFAIDGVFNHIRPGQGKDTISFKLEDMLMQDLQLVKSEKLPITITRSNINVAGLLTIEKTLSLHTEALFNPVSFSSHATTTLGNMFAEAFNGISHFNISADVNSDFKKVDFKIRSDMDDQIKQSLKQQWDARVAAFQQKIKDRLDAEEQKVRGRIETEVAKLDQKKLELENKLKQTDDLLRAKVDDFKEQKQQQLEQKKDAAIDKLKNRLKR